jgi:hypothetical protein
MTKSEIISIVVQILLGISAVSYLLEKLKVLYQFCYRRIKFYMTPKGLRPGIVYLDPYFSLGLKWTKVEDQSYEISGYTNLYLYGRIIPVLKVDEKQYEYDQLLIDGKSTAITLKRNGNLICVFVPQYKFLDLVMAGKKLSPEQYLAIKSFRKKTKII